MGQARHKSGYERPKSPQPVLPPQVHRLEKNRSARRRITPEAGHALEKLGHAIEYLADEYVHAAGSAATFSATDSQVEAMQILMAANRQVYYECPLIDPGPIKRGISGMTKWIHLALHRFMKPEGGHTSTTP